MRQRDGEIQRGRDVKKKTEREGERWRGREGDR